MKKSILIFAAVICMILAACREVDVPVTSSESLIAELETTTPMITQPATASTIPPTTEPLHSSLYLPDVSVEDAILYFNEVSLSAEFTSGGNPSLVQRWEEPIYYIIYGNATDADMDTLSNFAQWLNAIENFPGIHQTEDPVQANMRIYFCTESELLDLLGDNFYGTDGGVTFWYQHNVIYDAIICYRTDLDQELRNSVILEEIYNGLGPVQDTDLRQDSIIYSGYSMPQHLTAVDELILKLLYHPDIQCGMNVDDCEEIIRQIYY